MPDDTNYLEGRFREQREWHNARASSNKNWFFCVELVTLVCAAAIPVVMLWTADHPYWGRVLAAMLGALVVVTSGLGKLFKFHENWLQYRTLVEDLDREKVLYVAGVGQYERVSGAARETAFVQRVENLLARTTAEYVARHRASRDAPPQQPDAGKPNPPP